jgi:hypothetical protein
MVDLVAIFNRLQARIAVVKNEAEVRQAWTSALEAATGLEFDTERMRKDLSFNNVIIEFKDRGLFRGKADSPAFLNAKDERLLPYIRRSACKDGLEPGEYVGIAIDGVHVAFGQVRGDEFVPGELLPVNLDTFRVVAQACRDGYRRAVTSENLAADFGHASSAGRQLMKALSEALACALTTSNHPKAKKVEMLFEEWRSLYGQCAGMGILQEQQLMAGMGFAWNGPADRALPASLFVVHTFHSLLVKILVAECIAAHGLAASPSFVDGLLARPAGSRIQYLEEEIERSRFFSLANLRGFVEEAIFSWYADSAFIKDEVKAALDAAVVEVAARLHGYRLDTLRKTERSRDVLRDLYQDVVPRALRKSLGEFYTPDWLVDVAVDRLDWTDEDWRRGRVLDPTCGSGSFLIEVMRRKRAALEAAGYAPAEVLQELTSSVWGFDLNPLAVQTARANVVLFLADLLRACGGVEVEIPVLLADAVYSPAPDPSPSVEGGIVRYTIGSSVANLEVVLPTSLALDRPKLDAVFEVMGREVEAGRAYPLVEKQLVSSAAISTAEAMQWSGPLQATYERVLDLHRRDWNGIWFRIVRNFFWSATAGRFDAIVGNPPWVRWSNLPPAYRDRIRPRCEAYDIFSDTGYFGGNELDISAMITFTSADKWLKDEGRLVFLVTQTLFQAPSSQGFRRFRVDDASYLSPVGVDDLKSLRPFPDAANKTALASFRKTTLPPAFPVPYRVWDGMMRPGTTTLVRNISPAATKLDVLSRMVIREMQAVPADEAMRGSPWSIEAGTTLDEFRVLRRESTWVQGRKGITTDLNGVFFVEVESFNETTKTAKIRTRPTEGRTDIGAAKTAIVETSLLFPLLKGAGDFSLNRLHIKNELYAFVPNQGIDRSSLDEARDALNGPKLAKTRRYFEGFLSHLKQRSTYRRYLQGSGAHPAVIFNVGDYTFAPFKVVWPEIGSFRAAVVRPAKTVFGDVRPVVPDHKVYFAAFNNEDAAFYLCGILNCSIVRGLIEGQNVGHQLGNVFKHFDPPEFDDSNPEHIDLARATREAHVAKNASALREASERAEKLAVRILKVACGGSVT